MQKIVIPLSDAMAGMLVAEAIRNLDTGIVYIGENQELTADAIEYLKSIDIDQIKIYVNTWDDVWKISKETIEEYKKCTETAKKLLRTVAQDNVVDFATFKEVKSEITEQFSDNYKIIGCINLFKEADSYTYTHSINVALLSVLIGKWMKFGQNMIDSLMIAGLLHDTVEDTDVTMEEIEENFGPRVRQLVEGETEDKMKGKPKADTWKQRKLDSLKELKENSDINEKMVWLCDKYSNVRSMYIHYTKNGPDTFKAFNESDPAMHKWYYQEIAETLKDDLGEQAIYKEYVALVNKLFKEF